MRNFDVFDSLTHTQASERQARIAQHEELHGSSQFALLNLLNPKSSKRTRSQVQKARVRGDRCEVRGNKDYGLGSSAEDPSP